MIDVFTTRRNLIADMEWCRKKAKAPRLRSFGEFAEQEIILPTGNFQNRKFRMSRQPFTRLLFAEMSQGGWETYNTVGPSQSGKTLCGSAIPIMYHLFEVGETVIFGCPAGDVAYDKWVLDIKPIIEKTRYRKYLPSDGLGSRGGKPSLIQFRNGPALRFMTAGGGDKSRAGFTARVLVITETDGMDTPGEKSKEADKVRQMLARTRSFRGDNDLMRYRVYMECTTSTKKGTTWATYEHGTQSRIAIRCPYCEEYVTPDREHFVGWEDADNEIDAAENTRICCPACGALWDEQERLEANQSCVLAHRGQEVLKDGGVIGDPPRTKTLGFRWGAVNNSFVSIGDVGADEWRAKRSEDEDNSERELLQFVHAKPYEPPEIELRPLAQDELLKRTSRQGKGVVPDWAKFTTAAIDVHKRHGDWVMPAWNAEGRGHLVDYASFEIPSDMLGEETAIPMALRTFAETVPDMQQIPAEVWVDSGYRTAEVYAFCREMRTKVDVPVYRPIKGHGFGQAFKTRYDHPARRTKQIVFIGEQYHISRDFENGIDVVHINADYWKSRLHERLGVPVDSPTAMTFHDGTVMDHMTLVKHLLAEHAVTQYIPKRGEIEIWLRDKKDNHFFDAMYIAMCAAHFCGMRLVPEPAIPEAPAPPPRKPLTTPDGRPYLITQRR